MSNMEENTFEFDKEVLIIFVTKVFGDSLPPDLMHSIKISFNEDDDMIIRFDRKDEHVFQEIIKNISRLNCWDTMKYYSDSEEYLI